MAVLRNKLALSPVETGMTDVDSLNPTPLRCHRAAARLASDMALNGAHMDELGQVGASLRHCFDARDSGDDAFQDLLSQLS